MAEEADLEVDAFTLPGPIVTDSISWRPGYRKPDLPDFQAQVSKSLRRTCRKSPPGGGHQQSMLLIPDRLIAAWHLAQSHPNTLPKSSHFHLLASFCTSWENPPSRSIASVNPADSHRTKFAALQRVPFLISGEKPTVARPTLAANQMECLCPACLRLNMMRML
jgi:hypothetical protein